MPPGDKENPGGATARRAMEDDATLQPLQVSDEHRVYFSRPAMPSTRFSLERFARRPAVPPSHRCLQRRHALIFAQVSLAVLQRSKPGTSGLAKAAATSNPITSKASSRRSSRCYLEWLAALDLAATPLRNRHAHRLNHAPWPSAPASQPLIITTGPASSPLRCPRNLILKHQAIGGNHLSPSHNPADPRVFRRQGERGHGGPAPRIESHRCHFIQATNQLKGYRIIDAQTPSLEGAKRNTSWVNLSHST